MLLKAMTFIGQYAKKNYERGSSFFSLEPNKRQYKEGHPLGLTV